jgi:hypothetical protein
MVAALKGRRFSAAQNCWQVRGSYFAIPIFAILFSQFVFRDSYQDMASAISQLAFESARL